MNPFLICRASDYPELRDRASRAPWSDMVGEARTVLNTYELPKNDLTRRGFAVRDLTGAAALLYVIDESARAQALSVLASVFDILPAHLLESDDVFYNHPNKWSATVPMSSGHFNAVLALDVIHDALSPDDLARYESALGDIAEWFWKENRGHTNSTFGPRVIWALYKGDDRLQEAMDLYRDGVAQQMTGDGVGTNGGEYSLFRMNGQRTAKYGFMHVAEYTGVDPCYYNNPSIGTFYEWLFAAACSPFHEAVTFGDSGHDIHYSRGYPQAGAWLAHRFSPRAAEYAAWRGAGAGVRPPSDLLTYCATQEPLPKGRTPESRTWTDGGALFYEDDPSEEALCGQFWNVSRPDHNHFDANAIYLAGYGEHLLLNSGYNGWGRGFEDYTWKDIHDSAVASNVVLVDGMNHLEKGADGVVESLLGDGFDYVCGRADRAFEGDTRHDRSFAFVHPRDGAPGWFFLVDEVESPGESINLALHPASADVSTDVENAAYTWTMRRRKPTDTFLTIHLATPPGTVEMKDGPLTGHSASFIGKYLYATYPADSERRSLLTLLIPHDADHPQPDVTRLSEGDVSASRLVHPNGVVDTVCSTASDELQQTDGISWSARAVAFRQVNGALVSYFARSGRRFESEGIGFESDAPVSVHMVGAAGTLMTQEPCEVTFRHPGLQSLQVDGKDTGSTSAQLLPGSYAISLTI